MPQPFTAAAMPQELQLPLNALSSVSSRALPLHSHCTPTALTALPYTPTCSCSPSPFSLPGRLKMAATSARPQLLQPRGSVGRTEPSRNKALTKHSARIAHTALIPPSPSVGTHPCRTQPSVHRCAACRHFGSYLCLEGCSSAPPSLPFPSRALSEPRSSRPPPGLPPPPHPTPPTQQGSRLGRLWSGPGRRMLSRRSCCLWAALHALGGAPAVSCALRAGSTAPRHGGWQHPLCPHVPWGRKPQRSTAVHQTQHGISHHTVHLNSQPGIPPSSPPGFPCGELPPAEPIPGITARRDEGMSPQRQHSVLRKSFVATALHLL